MTDDLANPIYAPVPLDQARDRELVVLVPRTLLRRLLAQASFVRGFLEEEVASKTMSAPAQAFSESYIREIKFSCDAVATIAQIGEDEDLDD